MGELRGFLRVARQDSHYRPVCERVRDFKEVFLLKPEKQSQEQASRCMDCGTPFCHWACPVGNFIPEWNDYLFRGNWGQAWQLLEATNNLPEVTGRVCPALCEYACVLGLNDEAITIRENELATAEYAFGHNLIKAAEPERKIDKKVAIVGSGPAGLSCAAQLNRAGYKVVVFERDAEPGGILRYGIPDFKLEKGIIDRRIGLWEKEGIIFKTGVNVGIDYPTERLLREFDAICLAGGSRVPRDLKIEGRELKGIHFAMDYLVQSNKRIAGQNFSNEELIDAEGKKVVVIGGGDTGADCVGIAHRQGASCVVQIEVLERPPEYRTKDYPWPKYPLLLKTSTSHEEGGQRLWSILTKRFIGENDRVKKLSCVRVAFDRSEGTSCAAMREIPGSEFEIEADLVIIAAGFLHPEHTGLLEELKVTLDERGNVKTDKNYLSTLDRVFSAGDMRRGQSLVVWAIAEGRRAAYCMDKYLRGESNLPIV